jgi:hypothetical protein
VSDSEHFRERAQHLRRLAAQTSNREIRLQLLTVAADWWRLAEQAAKSEGQAVETNGREPSAAQSETPTPQP